MMWTVETLDETVDNEIKSLPDDMRARLVRVSALIEGHGLEQVGEPHIKHLEGKLWEIRLKGRGGISRALYVTLSRKRVVIVRVFIKKTEKRLGEKLILRLCEPNPLKNKRYIWH
jgi:phage-related protein